MNRFNYQWYMKSGYPAKGIDKHSKKVFSTFACGGGSTMGYKLAGYDVIGANDIDTKMAKVYKENHKPNYFFQCSISDLLNPELPEELYNLDILDGSPPCSTFSLAGKREKNWKKNKVFREGQSEQVLSDLFFEWIKLVDKLRPKVAIAENVKGMLIGNAKLYTKEVVQRLQEINYDVQVFLLNGASMGLPQRRERVFFICKRKDLKLPILKLSFNETPIKFKEFADYQGDILSENILKIWSKRLYGDKDFSDIMKRESKKDTNFGRKFIYENQTPVTVVANDQNVLFSKPLKTSIKELSCIGSFPLDYNFLDVKPEYLIGMSVPPIMMAQVSYEVYNQLLR